MKGDVKEGLELTPMGSLDVLARGASTLDLASACVLRPLNHLVLYFKMGGVTGRTSGGLGYTGLELAEGVTTRGGVEADNINGK